MGRHVSGDRISAFLDDELDDASALAVTRHLAACGACHHELEELRATRDALRRLPDLRVPAPWLTPGEEGRALGTDGSLLRRVRRRLRLPSTVLAVLLGVVGVALAGVAYVAGEERGEVVPPVELFLVDHVARTGGGPLPAPVGSPQR